MKQSIITIAICLIILAGVNIIYAWTGPGCNPPDCNEDAPINVSDVAQQKTGALRVGGLTSDYNSYLATLGGKVGIKTTSPDLRADVALDVGGNIITGVKTPVNDNDAVNKGYVDTQSNGGTVGGCALKIILVGGRNHYLVDGTWAEGCKSSGTDLGETSGADILITGCQKATKAGYECGPTSLNYCICIKQ